jgi:ribonuclease P protein component
MLNRAHRLRLRSEFTTAVRTGRRAGRRTLVVHLQPPRAESATGGDGPRAGFVVSRAVGGAVTRNTVRRRLRHLVRAHLSGLPAGSVLVVRALPPAARAPYAHLDVDLTAALRSVTRARNNDHPGRAR